MAGCALRLFPGVRLRCSPCGPKAITSAPAGKVSLSNSPSRSTPSPCTKSTGTRCGNRPSTTCASKSTSEVNCARLTSRSSGWSCSSQNAPTAGSKSTSRWKNVIRRVMGDRRSPINHRFRRYTMRSFIATIQTAQRYGQRLGLRLHYIGNRYHRVFQLHQSLRPPVASFFAAV